MAKQGGAAVPRLRFPGFDEPWSNDPLSKTLVEHKLKNTDGRDVFSVSMESGIVNQIEHLGRSFAASDTAHYNLGRRFDLVYTKSPLKAFPFGIVKQCKFDGKVALSPLYGVFTPDNPHVGLMIEAYFESPSRSKAFLSPLCQKGAKNTIQITNKTFLSGCLPLPKEHREQQKIADCLTSLDEVIVAQGRKVEALKAHKRGLMQQLFPREGETRPCLRFPEFHNAPEWKEKEIGEVFRVTRGEVLAMPLVKGERSRETPYPVYSSQTKNQGLAGYFLDFLYEDAITWTTDGANAGEVNYREGKFYCTNVCGVLLSNEGYANRCVAALLNTVTRNHVSYVGNPKLMNGVMAKIRIPFPPLKEQQRIANCLSSLDAQIAAEFNQLAALKTHKQGLMQQLFPAPEQNS